jgi:hypothetical protein
MKGASKSLFLFSTPIKINPHIENDIFPHILSVLEFQIQSPSPSIPIANVESQGLPTPPPCILSIPIN